MILARSASRWLDLLRFAIKVSSLSRQDLEQSLLRVFLLALPFVSPTMLFYNVFLSRDTSIDMIHADRNRLS